MFASGAQAQITDELIAKSKTEPHLSIYSNVATYNWKAITESFAKKYPWIKIEALDIGPAEAFERYYAESAAGKHSADVIVAASPSSWMRFVDKGETEEIDFAEGASAPAWSKPFKGVYSFSTDPLIIVYNKLVLPENERPKSLKHLVELVGKDPKKFQNKITTYDATGHPFAEALHWTYTHVRGEEGWKILEALGPVSRPENGGGPMVEKVTTGEYSTAYFVSGVSTFIRTAEAGRDKILGWSLIEDGTPVFVRNVAVTKKAVSKASARIFVEWALSHEGQVAIGKAGMTPYRADVKKEEVPFLTYTQIVEKLGEKNVIPVVCDRAMLTESAAFLTRWKQAFKL